MNLNVSRPLILSLGLIFAAFGLNSKAAEAPRAAAPEASPEQIIGEGLDKILGLSRQPQNTSPSALLTQLEQEVGPYFDFDYMAESVAGPTRRNMNAEQSARFASQLKRMFLGSMAERLAAAGSGYRYRMLRPQYDRSSGEVRVNVRVMGYDRPSLQMGFRLYHSAKGWRVFDVLANNSSAIIYYRNYFAQTVQQRGVDALYRP